jgi:hypothetical protein
LTFGFQRSSVARRVPGWWALRETPRSSKASAALAALALAPSPGSLAAASSAGGAPELGGDPRRRSQVGGGRLGLGYLDDPSWKSVGNLTIPRYPAIGAALTRVWVPPFVPSAHSPRVPTSPPSRTWCPGIPGPSGPQLSGVLPQDPSSQLWPPTSCCGAGVSAF